MAYTGKKVCINKSYTFIGLIALAGTLLIFLNFQFLQTTPKTNTRAKYNNNNKLSLPSPGPLTSEPKKIMEYWITNELALLNQTNNKDSVNYDGAFQVYTEIKKLRAFENHQFLGDFSVAKLNQYQCLLSSPIYTSPITTIFKELAYAGGGSSNLRLNGISDAPLHISFFKNTKNGEIDAFIFSSFRLTGPNAGKVGLRAIPYKTFVNAFSAVLKKQGTPMTNTSITKDGPCNNPEMKIRWARWAESVVSSDRIYDPLTPGRFNLNAELPITTLQTNINMFTNGFQKFIGQYKSKNEIYFLPETEIGPLQQVDFWGRTHITYFIDGGRVLNVLPIRPEKSLLENTLSESIGNYSKLLLLLSYLTTDYPNNVYSVGINNAFYPMPTPVPTKISSKKYQTHVYASKMFINYILSHCDVYAPTIYGLPDGYNAGFNEKMKAMCPVTPTVYDKINRDSLYMKEYQSGAFVLHFRPINEVGAGLGERWMLGHLEDQLANLVISVGMGD